MIITAIFCINEVTTTNNTKCLNCECARNLCSQQCGNTHEFKCVEIIVGIDWACYCTSNLMLPSWAVILIIIIGSFSLMVICAFGYYYYKRHQYKIIHSGDGTSPNC